MTVPPALLRAPPFPGLATPFSQPLPAGSDQPHAPAGLLDALRQARVGGAFWAESAFPSAPGTIVVRDQAATSLPTARRIAPSEAIDPWSVVPGAAKLVAHGDDEWVALAAILDIEVEVLSPGGFGAPGDDAAALNAKAAQALTNATYHDPFTHQVMEPLQAIALLGEWRRILDGNRGIVVASGMAWWKRAEIRQFLWASGQSLQMISSPRRALAAAQKQGGAVAIWPSRVSPALLAQAKARGVPLVRVEDGFVRSVGLGSNLVPPSSIVVDRRGIHFDPSGPSDLEVILAETRFDSAMLERARALRETIVAKGISKYAAGTAATLPQRQKGRRLVLVPGQVEDDMSVLAGGGGLHSNFELLRRARALEPDAEIWFRPHPDVDAGHRKGAVPDDQALSVADRIMRGGGMAPLLDAVDAVHCLTSLTGFEALMRGREVTCHGTPFYAGWGLTRDLGAVPDRRGRQLSLDELVAGVLILYPRYLDPVTGLPCPPEVLVSRMASDLAPNRLDWIAGLRRWQGKLMAPLRRLAR